MFPDADVLDDLNHHLVMFGFLFSVRRHYYRSRLGSLRPGADIRGLGPQGKPPVADHLVYLCHFTACPPDAGLARQTDCVSLHWRICGGFVHLFRGEFVTRITQLRIVLIMDFFLTKIVRMG